MRNFILTGLVGLVGASSVQVDLELKPLQKVVKLLKTMIEQNEKEASEDQEIFDKLACWCHTNREEKTQAVEDNTSKIAQLESTIKELTAKHAELTEQIKNLKSELKENKDSLEAAKAQRKKEAAEFHKYETDTVQALGQLKGAITILKKHQDSFLQGAELSNIKSVLKSLRYSDDRENALSLIDARPYANQSSEIFGILQSMQETMEADLGDEQKAEMKAIEEFTAMKTAKEEEIATQEVSLEKKEQQHADTGLALSEAKEDLKDTQATLEADQAFLVDLEKRCADNEAEMEERTKIRQQEITALNETIEILTADETRDLQNKTLVFLQTNIKAMSNDMLRQKAKKTLAKVAMKTGNPELAMLATSVQLDAFTKVKKAIDDMVAALKKDQADEVKHKDYCNEEFHNNEMTTTDENRNLEDLQAKQGELEQSISEFVAAIKQNTAEIAEMRSQLQAATLDRQKESKTFQASYSDQKQMQVILQKAMKRLDAFYGAKDSFVQESSSQGPPPGLKQGGYTKNAGNGGVMTMLAEIIKDSEVAVTEAVKAEQAATVAYEEFVATSNSGIATRQRAIVAATDNKAQADKELVATKESISASVKELESLANYKADLHKTCDFVVKNFEIRQTARLEEIEALQQAKQILSGAQ